MQATSRLIWAALAFTTIAVNGQAACAQSADGYYDSAFGGASLPLWQIRSEYLMFWTNGNPLPPLVSTSPPGTPRSDAGVLGTPGAEVLFGGESIDNQLRSGGRIGITRWLDAFDATAIEFTGFYVGDDTPAGDFVRESDGSVILSRPFFNVDSGVEDAELVSFPNVIEGRVTVATYSDLYSGAIGLRHAIGNGPIGRIDLIGGYRYFKLREDLSVRENLRNIDQGGVIPFGTTTDLVDRFSARNDFHGGELGVAGEFLLPLMTLEIFSKVALGSIHRQMAISGETSVTVPGNPPLVTPGGLLALPTNIGTYSETGFGVLPEFGMNATVALTDNLSFVCGYTLIVLSDVLRTGNQIDRVINTSQIGGDPLVGAPRPTFDFQTSHLVLQGINLGISYAW